MSRSRPPPRFAVQFASNPTSCATWACSFDKVRALDGHYALQESGESGRGDSVAMVARLLAEVELGFDVRRSIRWQFQDRFEPLDRYRLPRQGGLRIPGAVGLGPFDGWKEPPFMVGVENSQVDLEAGRPLMANNSEPIVLESSGDCLLEPALWRAPREYRSVLFPVFSDPARTFRHFRDGVPVKAAGRAAGVSSLSKPAKISSGQTGARTA